MERERLVGVANRSEVNRLAANNYNLRSMTGDSSEICGMNAIYDLSGCDALRAYRGAQ